MNTNLIIFVLEGQFDGDFLFQLKQQISTVFQIQLQFVEGNLQLEKYFDSERKQYNAEKLIKDLDSLQFDPGAKKIGLFRVDLFIPILTYIFGQAYFRGNTGVVSLYRLRNEQYGLKPDGLILYDRFYKVILHELGHTFGLVHCHVPDCVMRSSTYVEDIDQKKSSFCPDCMKQLSGQFDQ